MDWKFTVGSKGAISPREERYERSLLYGFMCDVFPFAFIAFGLWVAYEVTLSLL